jgi:hypothetical protein
MKKVCSESFGLNIRRLLRKPDLDSSDENGKRRESCFSLIGGRVASMISWLRFPKMFNGLKLLSIEKILQKLNTLIFLAG